MNLRLGALGIILILLGIVGFLTVADDLRHKGEIFGVGSILVTGLVLLVASIVLRRSDKGTG